MSEQREFFLVERKGEGAVVHKAKRLEQQGNGGIAVHFDNKSVVAELTESKPEWKGLRLNDLTESTMVLIPKGRGHGLFSTVPSGREIKPGGNMALVEFNVAKKPSSNGAATYSASAHIGGYKTKREVASTEQEAKKKALESVCDGIRYVGPTEIWVPQGSGERFEKWLVDKGVSSTMRDSAGGSDCVVTYTAESFEEAKVLIEKEFQSYVG